MKQKLKEIRDKEDSALRHELVEKQRHLFDLRSQAVTEKLENPNQLRATRREIARMKTILRERQLTGQREQEKQARQQKAQAAKAQAAKARAEKAEAKKARAARKTQAQNA